MRGNAPGRFHLKTLIASMFLLAIPCGGQQEATAANQRAVLEQILRQTYQVTVVGKGIMGLGSATAIRRAGVVVVTKRTGFYASLDPTEPASMAIQGQNIEIYRGHKDYEVPIGERFYVHSIYVGEKVITLGLLSGRIITVPAGTGRLWTSASFFFAPEILANADKDTVFRAIDPWLEPEGHTTINPANSIATVPAAAAPAAAPAPVAAPTTTPAPVPEPPPNVRSNLTAGMTREQVVAALGPPQREISFQTRTWLHYPDLVVVLENGKLISVATTSDQLPAKAAIRSEPPGAEIYVDDALVGTTPSTIDLPPGNHKISLRLPGYQEWLRSLHVFEESEINLQAVLEKK